MLLEGKKERIAAFTGKVPGLGSIKLWIIQLTCFVTLAFSSIILKTYSQCEISCKNRKNLTSVNICSANYFFEYFFP